MMKGMLFGCLAGRTALLATGAALLLALGGCDDGSSSSKRVTKPNDDGDVRTRNFDAADVADDGFVDVEFREGDVSMLLQIAAEDPAKGLGIAKIIDPDDNVIYELLVDPNTGEPQGVKSDFIDNELVNTGDAAVFLPPTPELAMKTGRYRFEIVAEDDVPLRSVTVLQKSVPDGENVDQLNYELDINFWIAHPEEAFNGEAFERTVNVDYRDTIDRILAPHAMKVGEIKFYRASAAQVADYAELDIEEEMGKACGAMNATVKNSEALNLGFVQTLVDPDSEDGPAGIAPGIGVIRDSEAVNGCVYVAQTAYVANPDEDLSEDQARQMQASNILHEAAHFMSLDHTTEAEGDDFDHFADTPECDAEMFDGRDNMQFGVDGEEDGIVTDFECAAAGGATNFIFYSGVQYYLPFIMSTDQAKTIRRHPLLKRSG